VIDQLNMFSYCICRFVGGTLLTARRASTLASCLHACEVDEECNSFNYIRSRRRCYLYAEEESELDIVDSTSTQIGYWFCNDADYDYGEYADVQYDDELGSKNGGKHKKGDK
jgi:hypothetical protein